jgi:hypothetical protein
MSPETRFEIQGCYELGYLDAAERLVRRRVCLDGKRLRLRVSERHRLQVFLAAWTLAALGLSHLHEVLLMAAIDRGPNESDDLPISRMLLIGGVSKFDLLQRLEASGVELNDAGRVLFADPRFSTSESPSVVETVETSVAALGFPDGATYSQILEAAVCRKLDLCPLELGPHFRLQCLGQSEGFVGQSASQHRAPPGSITVASQPLSEDDNIPKGFYLRRISGVLWLRGYHSGPDHVWSPEDRFLFCNRECDRNVRAGEQLATVLGVLRGEEGETRHICWQCPTCESWYSDDYNSDLANPYVTCCGRSRHHSTGKSLTVLVSWEIEA